MSMKITIIPTLDDNYTYLLEASNGETAIIDAGDAAPIIEVLEAKGLGLNHILLTHHHYDHIDGAPALKQHYNAKIAAPKKDNHRIPNIDTELSEGDLFDFGDEQFQIIETPGHTTGHICYYAPNNKALFCADTLFSLGCGRLFEGTAEDMQASMEKLKALPDDTRIYPGHEYTQNNGEFCLSINPDNQALQNRMKEVRTLRAQNLPTIPTTLKTEKETNLFLQTKTARQFAELRSLKDNF